MKSWAPVDGSQIVEKGGMTYGKYEILLRRALRQASDGPWDKRDLDRVRSTLSMEFCLAFDQECDRDAVLDWLAALPPDEVEDLLDRLNALEQ